MHSTSIHTDYEKKWPKGIKREYWLNLTAQTISPDGFLKTEGKVLNNSYPGPLIEACWGDDIVRYESYRMRILSCLGLAPPDAPSSSLHLPVCDYLGA